MGPWALIKLTLALSKSVASPCPQPGAPGTPTLARLCAQPWVPPQPSNTFSTLTAPSSGGATAAVPCRWTKKPLLGLGPRSLSHRKLALNLEHGELLVVAAAGVNGLSHWSLVSRLNLGSDDSCLPVFRPEPLSVPPTAGPCCSPASVREPGEWGPSSVQCGTSSPELLVERKRLFSFGRRMPGTSQHWG